MAAGNYTFIIEQGSTTNFRIEYKDSTGAPIDLTAYDARMQIKNAPGGNIVYATLSSSLDPTTGTGLNMTPLSGSTILPKSSGSIGIFIAAISSSAFTFDEAYYDLEIVSGSCPSAIVNRILQGKIKLSKEVTTNGC